jgi:hypothetical protein
MGTMPRGQAASSSRLRDLGSDDGSVIELLIERLVDRVAAAVVARLEGDNTDRGDEWFDSAQAAEYLGLHRDTLRRLAAGRAIRQSRTGEAASCSSVARLSTSGANPVAAFAI